VGNLSKYSALIKLEFPSEKETQVILEALKPEAESPATPRSNVRIRREASTLILSFEAKDTAALRASLNSYLSWLYMLKNIHDMLKAKSR